MTHASKVLPTALCTGTGHAGDRMHGLIRELYPVCRSITGDGVRRTLDHLQNFIPLQVHEVPSGTQVFDWTVPLEWNIRDAFIRDAGGRNVVDFKNCNLHVVSYSGPVHTRMPLEELRQHLFTLPEQPGLIPYRTSYYDESWGFCLSQRELESMDEGEYEVCIDSSLADGALTYGECLVPGTSSDEVLFSCHVCHPSLCNDNLSGIAVATALAGSLQTRSLRYSYRFLFIPGTIGAITWLSRNRQQLDRIRYGLVLTCVGDSGSPTYKQTRSGDAEIDRVVRHILDHRDGESRVIGFSPYGYDERQYCSPGINLPVGCLMRTPNGQFPEYHTSADNPDFVEPEFLADSYALCTSIVDALEANRTYRNLQPCCEPQLGRRGIYQAAQSQPDVEQALMAIRWVLNLSDGTSSLLDIAARACLPLELIAWAADTLSAHDLLAAEGP